MSKKEIFAPAGDLQTLKVAVNSGADAVYLGVGNFNARYGAKNFSFEELKEGVQYAHLFDVKVYLTLNTIVKNNEFDEILKIVDFAIDVGVDAFLVQDMGLAYVLKNCYKGIELHASTQLACHNLQGAKVLENFGFSRVVLSREATLQDIKNIKQNTKLEVEYFVQGAHCVSFSGNCYFSSICTNCSGNRGKCKQFCRLNYKAFSKNKMLKQGYLLSPSDQCLADRMQELLQAGVDSFKIEGRLKKPSYVACAVKLFNNALDGKNTAEMQEDLKQIFARGEFNKGRYLDFQNDGLINPNINNHVGKKIGFVQNVSKFKDINKIIISSTHKVSAGDALKFFVDGKEICSVGVGNVENNGENYVIYSKYKPSVGAQVNLIVDSELEKQVLPQTPKLDCQMKFVATQNNFATLEMFYKNISVKVHSENIIQSAKTQPTCKKDVIANLSKLGDTIFNLQDCKVELENVFIAKSVINQMRRDAVQAITQKILDSKKPKVQKIDIDLSTYNIAGTKNYVMVDDVNSIAKSQDAYIFAPKSYEYDVLQQAVDCAKKLNVRLFLDLPNIARFADVKILENLLSRFTNQDFGLVANNIYAFIFKEKFEVVAGMGLNIINNYAKDCYLQLGATDIVYSVEANKHDVCQNGVVFSYGQPVLMTLTHCPIKMMFKNTCANCKYFDEIYYQGEDGRVLGLRRKKIASCYFELVDSIVIDNRQKHNFRKLIDLRKCFGRSSKISNGMLNNNI